MKTFFVDRRVHDAFIYSQASNIFFYGRDIVRLLQHFILMRKLFFYVYIFCARLILCLMGSVINVTVFLSSLCLLFILVRQWWENYNAIFECNTSWVGQILPSYIFCCTCLSLAWTCTCNRIEWILRRICVRDPYFANILFDTSFFLTTLLNNVSHTSHIPLCDTSSEYDLNI